MTLEHTQAAAYDTAAPMVTAITGSDILSGVLDKIETLMHDVVDSDVTVLRDASRHILSAGGKRIRPRLLVLSYLACGGQEPETTAPLAGAVELVHTASVVHDDINDHGVLRRGRPSVNAIWGRTFALLTGDFLFTKVYELMAPFKDLNVVLAEGTVALVEGETLQAQAVKENNFSREVYYRVIGLKTAALFSSAAKIGAMFANATKAQIDALNDFAYNIGLAFQIVDDVLDIIGDEAKLGKTAGIDVDQGRGFVSAHHGNGTAVVDAADPMASIKRRVLQGDMLDEARSQSRALVDMAIAKLDALPNSVYKQGLIDLANLVIEREF